MPLFTADIGVGPSGAFRTSTPDSLTQVAGSILNDAVSGFAFARRSSGERGPTQTDRDRAAQAPFYAQANEIEQIEAQGGFRPGEANLRRQKLAREFAVQFPDNFSNFASFIGISSGVNLEDVAKAQAFEEDPESVLVLQANKYLESNPQMAAYAALYSRDENGQVDPARVYGTALNLLAQEQSIKIDAANATTRTSATERAVSFLSQLSTVALSGLQFSSELVNAGDTSFAEGVTARDQLIELRGVIETTAQQFANRNGLNQFSKEQLAVVTLQVDNAIKLFEQRFGDQTIDQFVPFAKAKSSEAVIRVLEKHGLAITDENIMAISAYAFSADENKITEAGLKLAESMLTSDRVGFEALAAIDPKFNIDVATRKQAVNSFLEAVVKETGNSANGFQYMLDNVEMMAAYSEAASKFITKAQARNSAFSEMAATVARASKDGGPTMSKKSIDKLFPDEDASFGKLMIEEGKKPGGPSPLAREVTKEWTELFESSRQWRMQEIQRAAVGGRIVNVTTDRFGRIVADISVPAGTAFASALKTAGFNPNKITLDELNTFIATSEVSGGTFSELGFDQTPAGLTEAKAVRDAIKPHLEVIQTLDDKAKLYGLTGLELGGQDKAEIDTLVNQVVEEGVVSDANEIDSLVAQVVEEFEGRRLKAYRDEAGILTIGVGHTGSVEEGQTITDEEADALFAQDTADAKATVLKETKGLGLNAAQTAALISFVFNVGSGNFRSSTLLRRLKEGDIDGASEEFKKWNKVTKNGKKVVSNGLVRRRQAEADLFRSSVS